MRPKGSVGRQRQPALPPSRTLCTTANSLSKLRSSAIASHFVHAETASDNWKYLRVDGHEYLFDIVADGREPANLANRFPEKLSELRDHWHEWAKTMPSIPDDAFSHVLWDEKDMPRSTF
jgi:hypothetical protein